VHIKVNDQGVGSGFGYSTDNIVTAGYLANPGSATLTTGTGPNNP
jgi:hypothetical protein